MLIHGRKNNLYLDKKDFVRYLHVREERVRNLAIFKRNINFYHSDKKETIKSKFYEQNVYLSHLEIQRWMWVGAVSSARAVSGVGSVAHLSLQVWFGKQTLWLTRRHID